MNLIQRLIGMLSQQEDKPKSDQRFSQIYSEVEFQIDRLIELEDYMKDRSWSQGNGKNAINFYARSMGRYILENIPKLRTELEETGNSRGLHKFELKCQKLRNQYSRTFKSS